MATATVTDATSLHLQRKRKRKRGKGREYSEVVQEGSTLNALLSKLR
jgi:hypothetical protein